MHTMEDIERRTGLSRHFLNRCNSKLSSLLSPYRTYGENNRVLYDDDGLTIFDQIKQYKESGQNLTQTRETLEKHLQGRSQTDSETSQKGLQILQIKEGERSATRSETDATSQTQIFVEEIRRIRLEHQGEKNQHNKELKEALGEEIKALKAQVRLLLPDGRTPEDLQKDRDEAIQNKIEVVRLRSDKEAEQGRSQQRKALYAKLAMLNGWSQRKQRQAVLKEIERLDA